MILNLKKKNRENGFALVVTLSLMILLTVIAVGLLTLSTISLRSSTAGQANSQALANARLAICLAIGELQKNAGDDRRITADASIYTSASQPNLVGTWESWSPKFASNPTQTAPIYDTEKTSRFRTWLASAQDPTALKDAKWADTAVGPDWIRLFSPTKDGFDLRAQNVKAPKGSIAWVVSDEGIKAKVNVPGPEDKDMLPNVALQAQPRPSLALAANLKEPKSGWRERANRVLTLNQVRLDTELVANPASVGTVGASYTVYSQGLLTDTVKGGLKTDLNLGFEMSDADFAKDSWSGTPNPFRASANRATFAVPNSYKGQQPLFRTLVDNPIISTTTNFDPANVAHRFYAGGVPTFDHLRSFYRIPYHLYGKTPPTVAERGADHVAISIPPAGGGAFYSPANPPNGQKSVIAVRPVLNRLIYLLSASLDTENQLRLVITPVISLWNPYNTDLEIDGAVAYPWMDIPFQAVWNIRSSTGNQEHTVAMSKMMGRQFEAKHHGRSVDPFFFCELTSGGDGKVTKPIHFEPGEVRVFVPSSTTAVNFVRTGNNATRTIRMRPVDDLSMMTTRGGLSVPMRGGIDNEGFDFTMKDRDTVSVKVQESSTTGQFHYFVSLEDAARIRNPADSTRGQVISEVQMLNFTSAVNNTASPFLTFSELKVATQPFGVLETYQRVAKQSVGGLAVADLIYTTNPRQASINHQLSAGFFTVAPHYNSTLRSVADFSGAIQTSVDGRRSFWGASHSPSGKDHLSFFEIPREPLLSLAAFQHADLASSTFSPANQFANSWASPYLARAKTAFLNRQFIPGGVPIYDTAYLANEALWDGYFFSGAAPRLRPAASGNPQNAWKSPIALVDKSLKSVIEGFIANSETDPLANNRMRLRKVGIEDKVLSSRLLDPAGCTLMAAYLTVDGAFNVNSTNVEAWTAVLAGLRGRPFIVEGGGKPSATATAFPRFRNPTGTAGDNWNGFRELNDADLRTLATNIVAQIRKRGPFLSLGEFVNRRIENSDLGRSGTIQAAIDANAGINKPSEQAPFSTANYPAEARGHIIANTGVGIPGYLTQADVLQSIAPIITCRSDTFTIRGYGEARTPDGKTVLARVWCEAVVQRTPDFVDPTTAADSPLNKATPVNQVFGRRFEMISFRRLSQAEIPS